MKQIKYILINLSLFILIGCGSNTVTTATTTAKEDIGINTEITTTTESDIGIGHYIDSAIEGVFYHCGTQKGTTDKDGRFKYQMKQKCRFSINDITLREVKPEELFDGVQIFEDNVTVAQFLQSLDNDANATNGIKITIKTIEVLKSHTIVKLPKHEDDLKDIIKKIRVDNSDYNGSFITIIEVNIHLEKTRTKIKKDKDNNQEKQDIKDNDDSNITHTTSIDSTVTDEEVVSEVGNGEEKEKQDIKDNDDKVYTLSTITDVEVSSKVKAVSDELNKIKTELDGVQAYDGNKLKQEYDKVKGRFNDVLKLLDDVWQTIDKSNLDKLVLKKEINELKDKVKNLNHVIDEYRKDDDNSVEAIDDIKSLIDGVVGIFGEVNTNIIEDKLDDSLTILNTEIEDNKLIIIEPDSNLNNVAIEVMDDSIDLSTVVLYKVPIESIVNFPADIQKIGNFFRPKESIVGNIKITLPLENLGDDIKKSNIELYSFTKIEMNGNTDNDNKVIVPVGLTNLTSTHIESYIKKLEAPLFFGVHDTDNKHDRYKECQSTLENKSKDNINCIKNNKWNTLKGCMYHCTKDNDKDTNLTIIGMEVDTVSSNINTTIFELVKYILNAQNKAEEDLGLSASKSIIISLEDNLTIGYTVDCSKNIDKVIRDVNCSLPLYKDKNVTIRKGVGGYVISTEQSNILHLNIDDTTKNKNHLKAVSSHEYFHHVQSKIKNGIHEKWFTEGTAEWFVDYLDDTTSYYSIQKVRKGSKILEVGLNAISNPKDDKRTDHYDRMFFFKMLSEKCNEKNIFSKISENNQGTGIERIQYLLMQEKSFCDFGNFLGDNNKNSLASAMLYYQYATVMKNDITLLDSNEVDKNGNKLDFDFNTTIPEIKKEDFVDNKVVLFDKDEERPNYSAISFLLNEDINKDIGANKEAILRLKFYGSTSDMNVSFIVDSDDSDFFDTNEKTTYIIPKDFKTSFVTFINYKTPKINEVFLEIRDCFGDIFDKSKYVSYSENICNLKDDNIISSEHSTYRPSDPISRVEFLKIALLGSNHSITGNLEGNLGFNDVISGQWYVPYIRYAIDSENKIARGYDENNDGIYEIFGVNKNVSLMEAIKMILLSFNVAIEPKIDNETDNDWGRYIRTMTNTYPKIETIDKNTFENITEDEKDKPITRAYMAYLVDSIRNYSTLNRKTSTLYNSPTSQVASLNPSDDISFQTMTSDGLSNTINPVIIKLDIITPKLSMQGSEFIFKVELSQELLDGQGVYLDFDDLEGSWFENNIESAHIPFNCKGTICTLTKVINQAGNRKIRVGIFDKNSNNMISNEYIMKSFNVQKDYIDPKGILYYGLTNPVIDTSNRYDFINQGKTDCKMAAMLLTAQYTLGRKQQQIIKFNPPKIKELLEPYNADGIAGWNQDLSALKNIPTEGSTSSIIWGEMISIQEEEISKYLKNGYAVYSMVYNVDLNQTKYLYLENGGTNGHAVVILEEDDEYYYGINQWSPEYTFKIDKKNFKDITISNANSRDFKIYLPSQEMDIPKGTILPVEIYARDNVQLKTVTLHIENENTNSLNFNKSWSISETFWNTKVNIDTSSFDKGKYNYTLFIKDIHDILTTKKGTFNIIENKYLSLNIEASITGVKDLYRGQYMEVMPTIAKNDITKNIVMIMTRKADGQVYNLMSQNSVTNPTSIWSNGVYVTAKDDLVAGDYTIRLTITDANNPDSVKIVEEMFRIHSDTTKPSANIGAIEFYNYGMRFPKMEAFDNASINDVTLILKNLSKNTQQEIRKWSDHRSDTWSYSGTSVSGNNLVIGDSYRAVLLVTDYYGNERENTIDFVVPNSIREPIAQIHDLKESIEKGSRDTTSITVEGADTDLATMEFKVVKSGETTPIYDESWTNITSSNPKYGVRIPILNASEGEYICTLTVTDKMGYSTTDKQSFTITPDTTIDTIKPTTSVSGINAEYNIGDIVSITARANDNVKLSVVTLHVAPSNNINNRVVNMSWYPTGNIFAKGYEIDTSNLLTGEYQYSLFAKDSSGNEALVSHGSFKVNSSVAETEKPTGSVSGFFENYLKGNIIYLKLRGYDNEQLSKVTLHVAKSTDINNKLVNQSWDVDSWSFSQDYSIDTSSYSAGKYEYSLFVKDINDNFIDVSGSFIINDGAVASLETTIDRLSLSRLQEGQTNIPLKIYGQNMDQVTKVFIGGVINMEYHDTINFYKTKDYVSVVIPKVYGSDVNVPFGDRTVILATNNGKIEQSNLLYVDDL